MKAAKIYKSLARHVWEETLNEFHPNYEAIENRPATIGEFLEEARKYSSASPRTFGDYTRSFRRIVSDVMGFKIEKSRFDYRKG